LTLSGVVDRLAICLREDSMAHYIPPGFSFAQWAKVHKGKGVGARELADRYRKLKAGQAAILRERARTEAARRVAETDAYRVYGARWGHLAVPSACTVENLLILASLAWKGPIQMMRHEDVNFQARWFAQSKSAGVVGRGPTRMAAILAAIEAA
jgi:hypothetical protein